MFNVCGVRVHAFPAEIEPVAAALQAIPGLEIHARRDNGRLVVTLEDTAESKALQSLESIHRTPGMVVAALVDHQFEPDEAGTVGES